MSKDLKMAAIKAAAMEAGAQRIELISRRKINEPPKK